MTESSDTGEPAAIERDPELDHAVMMRHFGRYLAAFFISACFLLVVMAVVSLSLGSANRASGRIFESAIFALAGMCLVAGSMGFSWRRRVKTLTEPKLIAFKKWHSRTLMLGGLVVAGLCAVGFLSGFSVTYVANVVAVVMVAVQPAALLHWRFGKFVQWVDTVGYPPVTAHVPGADGQSPQGKS